MHAVGSALLIALNRARKKKNKKNTRSHTRTVFAPQTRWCENSEHVRLSRLCTLTLQLRITQRIIPVYVCASVCLPACLSLRLSIHPLVPFSVQVGYTWRAPRCCAASGSSAANEGSAEEVCLNGLNCAITLVAMSLLSAHKCCCHLQNYMALKHGVLLADNTPFYCLLL